MARQRVTGAHANPHGHVMHVHPATPPGATTVPNIHSGRTDQARTNITNEPTNPTHHGHVIHDHATNPVTDNGFTIRCPVRVTPRREHWTVIPHGHAHNPVSHRHIRRRLGHEDDHVTHPDGVHVTRRPHRSDNNLRPSRD